MAIKAEDMWTIKEAIGRGILLFRTTVHEGNEKQFYKMVLDFAEQTLAILRELQDGGGAGPTMKRILGPKVQPHIHEGLCWCSELCPSWRDGDFCREQHRCFELAEGCRPAHTKLLEYAIRPSFRT